MEDLLRKDRSERLRSLTEGFSCTVENGVLDFLTPEERAVTKQSEQGNAENALKNFFKRWPSFYEPMSLFVAPIVETGLTAKKFFRRFGPGLRLLNVGSGPTRLHPDVINVDLFPFRHVDVLADATHLPFRDGTFDAVCSDQLLEHVPRPSDVVAEILRVTKPGGMIYLGVPFIYPYHPSPKDYGRWSIEGARSLLPDCEVLETGMAMGPTSGMLVVLSMWLSIAFSFGIRPLRTALKYFFMLLLFPFKFLDYLLVHVPGAEDVAASVYVVARKRL